MISGFDPHALEVRLTSLEETCRALELARTANPPTPWYRSASTLISLFAVLFSFGTTMVSCQHTRMQDIQAARVDLRALLQRLAALPKENLALYANAQSNPAAAQELSSYINQEATILVKQAADTILRIPQYTSATECFTVGQSFCQSNQPREGFPFLEMAIAKAKTAGDEIGARRVYGYNLMSLGDLGKGREQLQTALTGFQRYPGANADVVEMTQALTEMFWAQAERSFGDSDSATRHLAEAYSHASRLRVGPQASLLIGQLDQTKARFFTGPQSSPTP